MIERLKGRDEVDSSWERDLVFIKIEQLFWENLNETRIEKSSRDKRMIEFRRVEFNIKAFWVGDVFFNMKGDFKAFFNFLLEM